MPLQQQNISEIYTQDTKGKVSIGDSTDLNIQQKLNNVHLGRTKYRV